MNKKRRLFMLSGGLGVAALLSGCVTKLFDDKYYFEAVSSILISQDHKKIVVIGKEYHYIFDAPDVLVSTLSSSYHKYMKGYLDQFRVDKSEAISGQYLLTLGKEATEQEKAEAITLGFVKSGGELIFSGNLNGIRYSSGGIQANVETQRLNKTYKVFVSVEPSSGKKAAKLLLTPVAVAATGALLIVGIPVGLLAGVSMCFNAQHGCFGK